MSIPSHSSKACAHYGRFAAEKTSKAVRERISEVKTTPIGLGSAHGRSAVRQSRYYTAVRANRQGQSGWYSTQRAINSAFERTVRQFSSSARTLTKDRSSYPRSRTSLAVSQVTSRTPFASTLRPNLTGGALSRSAGGYGLGSGRIGGTRYFSHTPSAPAEVVNNVSAAVRAFWLSGQRAQYDGIHPRLGERKYKPVTTLQDETVRKMRLSSPLAPGSFVDFKVAPSITAFGRLSNSFKLTKSEQAETLNSSDLLDNISIDFARALKDLAIVKNDLHRLSSLGDLPISLRPDSTIRVHFPGCDASTAERLCDEVGIRRGVVRQDPEFDAYVGTEMALLFPFVPTNPPSDATNSFGSPMALHKRDHIAWQNMLPSQVVSAQNRSLGASDTTYPIEPVDTNPCLSSASAYSSAELIEDDPEDGNFMFETTQHYDQPSDFEGLEGIYRFLAECDSVRR